MRHWIRATVLLILAVDIAAAQADPREKILGRWSGESVCVKEPWNAACHDEVIIYYVVPSTTLPGGVLLKAYKIVNGEEESMGDQELHYDLVSDAWLGDFTNARVSIQFAFRVRSRELTGTLVVRPDRRLARNIRAHRADLPTSP